MLGTRIALGVGMGDKDKTPKPDTHPHNVPNDAPDKAPRIRRRKITDYQPNPHNHNTGTERGAGMIEDSFRTYGAGRSLLADRDGYLIAGNQSQEGALNAGIQDVIEVETDGKQLVVVRRTDLDLDDPESTRAIELAYMDNRASEVSFNLDVGQIAADIEGGVDLSRMYSPDELAAFVETPVPTQGDETSSVDADLAQLQAKWNTQRGQLWRIEGSGGEHRLIIGDCTDGDVVARLFQGDTAQIAFTSPPYAMQRKETYGGIPQDAYVDWWEGVQAPTWEHLAQGGSFFVNIKPHSEGGERVLYVFDLVLGMRRRWGWRFVDEFCWQRHTAPGKWNDRFRNGFEPVYQFAKGKGGKFHPRRVGHESDDVMVPGQEAKQMTTTGTHYNIGTETQRGIALPDNVIRVQGVETGIPHPAMFPVGLPEWFMLPYTDEGDIVYDPFAGGGSTLVAGNHQNRRVYGVELMPEYGAVILERLSQMGLEPHLDSTVEKGEDHG
jgi:site-specific DNA-methyltransferase (adenine-specific)